MMNKIINNYYNNNNIIIITTFIIILYIIIIISTSMQRKIDSNLLNIIHKTESRKEREKRECKHIA